jgi:conjugative transfer signal peptidase TraF
MTERSDLPRFASGAAEDAAVRHGRKLRLRCAIGACCLSLLGLTIADPPLPRLVWNASASAPRGLYMVSPETPVLRGDMVIAWAPESARVLAARRRYLPLNVPLVKRVAAVRGDRVCAIGAVITIGNRPVAFRRTRDAAGRSMPWWRGCLTLRSGEVLLLTDAPASFDGRYFGPTSSRELVGRATPLWTWP